MINWRETTKEETQKNLEQARTVRAEFDMHKIEARIELADAIKNLIRAAAKTGLDVTNEDSAVRFEPLNEAHALVKVKFDRLWDVTAKAENLEAHIKEMIEALADEEVWK